MFDHISNSMAIATAIGLPLLGGALIFFTRHIRREHAHEIAIGNAHTELDKLAMTLSYAMLAAESKAVSRKHFLSCLLIKRELKALSKQREQYCEQGASTKEWLTLAAKAKKGSQKLKDISDRARDELYWATIARKSHRQAELALKNFEAPDGLQVDLTRAEQKLLLARMHLSRRQYVEAWEHSRLVNPLIDLHLEDSKLSDLIGRFECDGKNCAHIHLLDTAKQDLNKARSMARNDANLDKARQKLSLSRIKLENLPEQ